MKKQSAGAMAFERSHKLAFVWDMCGLVILFPEPNTTPLVSLDNCSTLTISDLFVAHSSLHPIDPIASSSSSFETQKLCQECDIF